MAGYSGTPLIQKLGIKPNSQIVFINEPQNLRENLGNIPNNVEIKKEFIGKVNYIHIFTKTKEELEGFFKQAVNHIEKDGMVWISWPKGSSKIKTDVNENIIREIGLKNGLVDVKVAAIDDTWSGLKFVYRIKDR